ncbi:MAG: NHL repeat-containing protein [Fimbriiglobus sp.]
MLKRAAVVGLFFAVALGLYGFLAVGSRQGQPDAMWGSRGVVDGKFNRPRAVALDPQGRLFIVDFAARIQGFSLNGNHLGHTWTTPDFRNGRPSGLGIDREGNVLVADSHYHSVRVYSAAGELLKTLGGKPGKEPGEWGYVSDVVQDADGTYYVSEFGQNDRITKLDADGKFLHCWGKNGQAEGDFNRVRALALGPDGLLYSADACNHRIQVFDKAGQFVRAFGQAGSAPGELSYPYDLAFHPSGDLVVVERGNHRVQRFKTTGEAVAIWGSGGSAPGQLADPWALAVDPQGVVYVVDTENHRVQSFRW